MMHVSRAALRMALGWPSTLGLMTLCLTTLGLMCCGASLHAAAPRWNVSSTGLHALQLETPSAASIAARLTTNQENLVAAASAAPAWNQPPAGGERAKWISVVTVGFNEQADAYAFRFDGPQGAMSSAMHVPFRKTWMANSTLAWLWPFDDLLGGLHLDLENTDRNRRRQPLHLRVVAWKDSDNNRRAPAAGGNLGEARAVDPQLVLSAAEVITNAAAFEAGWAPTTTTAEHSATCEVLVADRSCSFRLTLDGPAGKQVTIKSDVPWDSYHDHLVRMFRFASPDSGVSDFAQLSRGHMQLLAEHERRLATLVDDELTVLDLSTGQQVWTTAPVKPRSGPPMQQYTVFRNALPLSIAQKSRGPGDSGAKPAPSEPGLARYRGELSSFDWQSGERTLLAPGGADAPDRWAMHLGGEVATIAGGMVKRFRNQQMIGSFDAPAAIRCGPLLVDDRVIYGEPSGRVVARRYSDGQVLAEAELAGELFGPIVPSPGALLLFSQSDDVLLAVDPLTLAERWRLPIGDVLLAPPQIIGGQALVAAKNHRLLLVDLASGKIDSERAWPTWLIAVTLAGAGTTQLVVCADLDGTVTLLSLPELKTVREIRLSADLQAPLLPVSNMPLQWPGASASRPDDDLLDELDHPAPQHGPALMVADQQGFVYLLPLSGNK